MDFHGEEVITNVELQQPLEKLIVVQTLILRRREVDAPKRLDPLVMMPTRKDSCFSERRRLFTRDSS
jgi:hypothetical protein